MAVTDAGPHSSQLCHSCSRRHVAVTDAGHHSSQLCHSCSRCHVSCRVLARVPQLSTVSQLLTLSWMAVTDAGHHSSQLCHSCSHCHGWLSQMQGPTALNCVTVAHTVMDGCHRCRVPQLSTVSQLLTLSCVLSQMQGIIALNCVSVAHAVMNGCHRCRAPQLSTVSQLLTLSWMAVTDAAHNCVTVAHTVMDGCHRCRAPQLSTVTVAHAVMCLVYLFQVDAMKVGVKSFKKEYKNINIDKIEVSGESLNIYNWHLKRLWNKFNLTSL